MVREFLLWYERKFGQGFHADVLERLAPDDRRRVTANEPALGIVASTWYPSSILFAVVDSVMEGKSRPERSRIIREANADVVKRLTKGLYRALFRMVASPELYARHIQRLWNVLHDTGERSVVIVQPGIADSIIQNWSGHHPVLCEVATETMRAVFEAMGCGGVRVDRISCVGDGAHMCRAIVYYLPGGDP